MAIVADVYSEPPNIRLIHLHLKMGFQSLGAVFPDRNKTAAKFYEVCRTAKPKPAQTA